VNVSAFCSRVSAAAGEALIGTASRVDVWLLLEYGGLWRREAYEGSLLPERTRSAIDSLLRAVPHARVNTIKHERDVVERPRFFLAVCSEHDSRLYAVTLDTYEDLADLDLPGMVRGDAASESFRQVDPLYLVCTHGQHDRCCATFGVPTCRALHSLAPERAWQTSHLGGDRFAPNVACLPQGVMYGRVLPERVPDVVSAHDAGRVVLPLYRGRTCYPFPVQAAEALLREALGEDNIEAFELRQRSREGKVWTVEFQHLADDALHRVVLERNPTALQELLTCTAKHPQSAPGYRLLQVERL
jgi:hypothetical protein